MKPTQEQIAKLPKWAQAHLQDVNHDLASAKAFSWPLYPTPKTIPHKELLAMPWPRLIKGWFQNNYGDSFSVKEGCSDGLNHNPWSTDKTTTQGCGQIFRTKLDALQYCRIDMTRRFARVLAQIDSQIAEEIAKLEAKPQ